jgi:hypothetical protein
MPTARAIARSIDTVSHTTVAEALSGKRIPSWQILAKIVRVLGGDEDTFRRRWLDTVEQTPGLRSLDRDDPEPGPANSSATVASRFGNICPVCGREMRPTPQNKDGRFVAVPSFLLETGTSTPNQETPWRVHPMGYPQYGFASSKPLFTVHDVEFVYILCPNGHIFPVSAPVRRRPDPDRSNSSYGIDRWRMAAVIGPSGAGKTYLALRTLSQSLAFEGLTQPRTRERALLPLERILEADLVDAYTLTLSHGLPIVPTDLRNNQGTPSSVFEGRTPYLIDAVQEFIRREVVDGERRAEGWGRVLRQPLVLRTQYGDRSAWTGVADLPGEQFAPHYDDDRANARLRFYNALIWVLDPILSTTATEWFTPASVDTDRPFDDVLSGSLRPGSTSHSTANDVMMRRGRVQHAVGQNLGRLDSAFHNADSGSTSTLIAITKCDTLHAALGRNLPSLQELGRPGAALRGALLYLLAQVRLRREGAINPDPDAAAFLDYVAAASEGVGDDRIAEDAARALLDHYSDPSAFQELVHGNDQPHVVDISSATATDHFVVTLPMIDDHLDAWNRAGNTPQFLQIRDLVMSIVGCGVAYGLGYGDEMLRLLDSPKDHEIRIFLCSPLERVPIAGINPDEDENPLLEPINGRFPGIAARSASLTQLLLAILGPASE